MDTAQAFESLLISLGLGLLVGLQRERAGSRIGGIRTFPLITLLGTVAALVGKAIEGGAWVVAAGLLAVLGMAAMGNVLAEREDGGGGERGSGMTTEVAAVLMYALGAYAAVGPRAVVLAVGVVVAVILQAKGWMHALAERMGDKDIRAVMLFAAITFVVLPVLPDGAYGPLGVWSPRQIWLMVVLVVGISLAGYVVYKVLGNRARGMGTVVCGLLGGVISSTATTVTYSRRSRQDGGHAGAALLVIMLAGSVVYARLLTEISVAAPRFLETAAWPLGAMLVVSLALSFAVWVSAGRGDGEMPEPENPTELKSALLFAGLYAVVLVAVAAGKRYLGEGGIYAVSAVSGLTDMDAITLSTSRLVEEGSLGAGTAWRAIIVASMSNIVFKAGVVGVLGGRRLLAPVAVLFGVKVLAGVGLLVFFG